MKPFFHRILNLIIISLFLTNCISFDHYGAWFDDRIETNTKRDPSAYSEEYRSQYKKHRLYQKSLKRLEEKQKLEQIKKDKTL